VKITKVTPPPAPQPPATFDITGLTAGELVAIRDGLGRLSHHKDLYDAVAQFVLTGQA
jgi:hypothetical protein